MNARVFLLGDEEVNLITHCHVAPKLRILAENLKGIFLINGIEKKVFLLNLLLLPQ
jgi:hypothetical protein